MRYGDYRGEATVQLAERIAALAAERDPAGQQTPAGLRRSWEAQAGWSFLVREGALFTDVEVWTSKVGGRCVFAACLPVTDVGSELTVPPVSRYEAGAWEAAA